MSEEVEGNGAPYQIIVTLPLTNEVRTYECEDAETMITDLTTLAYVHVKENIRENTKVRTIFEIKSAPITVNEGGGGSGISEDVPTVTEEVKDGTMDGGG